VTVHTVGLYYYGALEGC